MAIPDTLAQVIRVLRPDSILVRAACPLVQSQVSVYMTPCGITCEPGCESTIIDWVELHADADRLALITWDWLRDEHGKLLADLGDVRTGETLTHYLLETGVAKERPSHMFDVLEHTMHALEPE
jgi:hypothetical protein